MNEKQIVQRRIDDSNEIRQLVQERIEMERAQHEKMDLFQAKPFTSERILNALDSNEDGDAILYVELHRGHFVFDHSAGRWYKWAGHFWIEDLLDDVTRAVEKVIAVYGDEARRQAWNRVKAERGGQKEAAEKHKNAENELLKRIRLLQTKGRKENVLFLARTGAASLGIRGDEWDRDPWLLGVRNGVIHLRSGSHRSGLPRDFIKTVAPVEWKGMSEQATAWERFLTGIFDGDRDLIAYLRRLFGYCTTGRTTEHILPILWGKGRNGKGTLLEVLGHVLGDYAGQVEAELLLKQKFAKHSGGPTSDIMNLRGKRLVWGSETDEGRKLNAGKLKWLTGGDTLTGREMYGRRQVSFLPSHKLILLTNYKPHAATHDYALWKRLHLIPFELSFVDQPTLPDERKADPALPDKLKAETAGILAWLVRGCLEWQRQGLNPSDRVKAATEAYRHEEDTLRLFLSECCQTGPGLEVQAGNLYSRYKQWCQDNGMKEISGVDFGKQIKERFDSYPNRNRVFYVGLDILLESKC